MINENEKELVFKLETEVYSDKDNYFFVIFTFKANSFLEINAIQKNDLFKNVFYNKFSPEIIKENEYFIQFDDINEIWNKFSEIIKNKEIKIFESKDSLIISISLPSSQVKDEITFQLNKNIKNDKEQINDLTNIVLELGKEVTELKNIIKYQNYIIDGLKQKMNDWPEYKIILNEKLLIRNMENSLIINKEQNSRIKDWINPIKNIKGELLYRLSRDGEKISTFHKLCDNKGPTLTLFQVEFGDKCGFYTPFNWDCYSGLKCDTETFMFNLNKNKKYKKKNNDQSLWCYHDHGPWTASIGFNAQFDNQMKRIQHRGLRCNDFYEKGAEILPNNTNNRKFFDIKEVKVYKIVFLEN